MQGLVVHGEQSLPGRLVGQELRRVLQQGVGQVLDHLVGLPPRGIGGEVLGLIETVVAENQHQPSQALDDQRLSPDTAKNSEAQCLRIQILTERLQQKVR